MKFRFRAFLSGPFKLPTDIVINKWEARFTLIGEGKDGSKNYFADFFVDAKDSSEAFHIGFERANKAADLLGYMSLSPVLIQPISATIPIVSIGEAFPISILQQHMHWNPAELSEAELVKFDITTGLEVLDLMRAVRASLTNEDTLASFVRCWAAFEPELEKLATENSLKTPRTTCPNCKAFTGGGRPASQLALQLLLDESNTKEADNPAALDARALRKLRGKIAHGADLGNAQFRQDFQGALPLLLSAIVMYIWKRSGIKTAFANRVLAFPELANFSMLYESETQVGIDWSAPANVKCSFSTINIAPAASLEQHSVFHAGLFEQQTYDIDFLPDLSLSWTESGGASTL